MRKGWVPAAVLLCAVSAAAQYASHDSSQLADQTAAPVKVTGAGTCACGAHPPVPHDRSVEPYAGEPEDMKPYSKFASPYDTNYTHPNIYSGAGRDLPDPKNLTEVRIGFFGPIEHNSDSVLGLRMLHGAQLAVEEANAHGGYGGIPFKLMLHNDYDNWQAGAVYGEDRPTDPTIWGSASNEVVKMVYDDKDWAIFGSISSESTHIALRVALRAEIPIVNSASTDPTIPETYIPWYFTDIQDDRVQGLTLARHIYTELGLKRVALLRVNNRYGRFGVGKFIDVSRRLGHPVVMEQIYFPGATDFARQLRVIRGSRADAIVLWADEADAAQILKQIRAAGMQQRVFGAYRTLGDTLLKDAGAAAEGFEAVSPYDPTRQDPRWLDFNRRFEARFNEKPEPFAALAFDAMNALLDSICKAGLNRARIHDALANIEQYDGVTGPMVFDPNQKNVAPLYLGTVHNGAISYRVAPMDKPPAAGPASAKNESSGAQAPSAAPQVPQAPSAAPQVTQAQLAAPQVPSVGEAGVEYNGPHQGDLPAGPVNVILFGPKAAEISQASPMLLTLAAAPKQQQWKLIPIESSQNWGAASTQLVHALMDEHALAIIALDRDAAHLATQLALKAFVPVVALSNDKTLTSTNIPWIFRLPEGTAPEAALRLLTSAATRSQSNPATASRQPNPERIRDIFASGADLGGIAFISTGERKGQ
jgi:ABC-type branched-subunit amino acid transport system substrate-binding protein